MLCGGLPGAHKRINLTPWIPEVLVIGRCCGCQPGRAKAKGGCKGEDGW